MHQGFQEPHDLWISLFFASYNNLSVWVLLSQKNAVIPNMIKLYLKTFKVLREVHYRAIKCIAL